MSKDSTLYIFQLHLILFFVFVYNYVEEITMIALE